MPGWYEERRNANLEVRRNYLLNELDRVNQKIATLENLGLDALEEGDVIWFTKRFNNYSRTYTYTALKCAGRWYTSGPKSPGPYTEEQLVEFLSSGVDEIWTATEWEQVQ